MAAVAAAGAAAAAAASSSARKLPIELQALLHQSKLSYRVPIHHQRPSHTSCQRSIVTLSADSRPFQSTEFNSVVTASVTGLDTQQPLFEQVSTEYINTPLSKLDHPSLQPREQPRSPEQALLALLEQSKHDEADTLRQDLAQAGQQVTPNIAFARHALHLFNLDSESSSWLNWWALAPSLTFLARSHTLQQVKAQRKLLASSAETIIDSLLQSDDRNWDRTRQFAALLGAQGHSNLVSEYLLVHLAAYAPIETSEAVWQSQLDALQQRYSDVDSVPDLREQNSASATRSLREWYSDAIHHETRLLVLKRQKMIKTHAAFGRLDLVVDLLDAQRDLTGPSGSPIRTRKSTLVWLMAIAAARDRYEVFRRIYAHLESSGGRLTRVTSAHLRQRIPYFTRGLGYNAVDAAPSASEAFATWRYRHHKSNLEEGFLEADEAEPGDTSQLLFAQEMSSVRPDFARASHLFKVALTEQRLPQVHVTASFIRLARAEGRFEVLGQLGALLVPTKGVRERLAKHWQTATMLADVQDGNMEAAVRRYMRYWLYTGLDETLVQALKQVTEDKRTRGAARKFRFTTDAYVLSLVIEALLPLLEPHGHSASPLVDRIYESLISELNPPKIVSQWSALSSSSSTAGATSSSSSRRPGHSRPGPGPGPVPRPVQTPLDPHTFTPFMTRLARLRAPPRAALDLVLDLQSLGLGPTVHQLGVLVASYARRGSPRDVCYLLELMEADEDAAAATSPGGEHSTMTVPDDLALQQLRSEFLMMRRARAAAPGSRPRSPARASTSDEIRASGGGGGGSHQGTTSATDGGVSGGDVDVIVYTGAVMGLVGQGEWLAAREVIERVRRRRTRLAVAGGGAGGARREIATHGILGGGGAEGDAAWRRVVRWVEERERSIGGGGAGGGGGGGGVGGQQQAGFTNLSDWRDGLEGRRSVRDELREQRRLVEKLSL